MPRPPILHVIPFLWSGAGGVVTRLCEEQRRRGPVAIVTTGRSGDLADWPAYRARLRKAGVAHHAIDFFHRTESQFWSSVEALDSVVGELRPAVIHAHAGVPACGVAVARAVSRQRVRVIGQMYSWGSNRPAWMDRQDTWGFAQADRVVCSARAYEEILLRHGVPARKLVYLPWGLPLEQLPYRGPQSPVLPRAVPLQAGPRIGFVGRIEPRKRQRDLVEAFAVVRRTRPNAHLDLVGPVADPAYAASIRAAIALHRLDAAVTLTGQVRDVPKRLRTWDLFVSLSSDEGQGLAVLEAMAVGVPVLASPVAGIDDFLEAGRTGFTVQRVTAASVARAIVRACGDVVGREAVAGRARRLVERRYAWQRTVRAFDRLYRI